MCFFGSTNAVAEEHLVSLVVAYKTVNFSGKSTQAITVNDQIPAPTLHFKEGDHVTINVYNHLDKGTSIHWHGIILPWQMDGVEGVTQKPIPPDGVFHYQFTLHQAGTYWYHAHADAQEQEGLYGALIIDPLQPPHYSYNRDYVIVLSDWSNTAANKILTHLKKDGDYYSPKFPLQPSLIRFIHDYLVATPKEQKQLLDDYKMMQHMRMSLYDLSDVAYDAFLLNGKAMPLPWTAPVKVGDLVRLRFIGAMGSTIYRVKMPGTKMKIVHIQGNDIHPYLADNFTIAPGETYDVLVNIKKDSPYIIYAESLDTLGKAVGALTTHPHQLILYEQVTPFSEPKPTTREMMSNMMAGMKMHPNMSINHSMNMPTEALSIGDHLISFHTFQATTQGTKYQNLTAVVKTNNPHKPISETIHMELFGYMDRFLWFINGLPEYKAHPIIIEPGKRYRIIFTNNSMMRHPMHIHGHWFILRNGHGAYDPLLHTIEVSPGATAVADVDADASGQWIFHCHHLYHMLSGMARLFQYSTLIEIVRGNTNSDNKTFLQPYLNRPIVRVDEQIPLDPSLVQHPMMHPMSLYFANFLDVGEDLFHNAQKISFKGLYGNDYNKIELFSNDAEINKGSIENANLDIFYWHLISQFWTIKGGANYFYRPAQTPYWQPGGGIEGLLPYFISTDVRTYYHSGSVKFDIELSRDTQITNNFFIQIGIRSILATKTVTRDIVGSGLNQMQYRIRPYYRLMPGLSVFTEYEHQDNYGAFKTLLQNTGESTNNDTITLGASILF